MNNSNVKKPAEMSFAEFADAMKPTGAVNRFPAIGAGNDVYSYQDLNFTFQKTSDGEVVTHENRRLGSMPMLNVQLGFELWEFYQGTSFALCIDGSGHGCAHCISKGVSRGSTPA